MWTWGLVVAVVVAWSAPAAAQSVNNISAFTQMGGTAISAGTWQTDPTPYMTWTTAAWPNPIVGYSISWDTAADCTVDTVQTAQQFGALGEGAHVFRVRAIDNMGSCGVEAPFSFLVDSQSETVTGLVALTQSGGSMIAPATWQIDATPFMQWVAVGSTAPVAGYSVAWDGVTDCTVEQTTTTFNVAAGLADGMHTFTVRAIDAAGNCGTTTTFFIYVDATTEPLTSLVALDSLGGSVIAFDTWQTDPTPYFMWTPSASAAPIAGYSYAFGGAADCAIDTTATGVAAGSPFADGSVAFYVRAIDDAGNCGPASIGTILVDTTEDAIGSLQLFTQAGGTPIAAATPQTDATPYATWSVVGLVSPSAGFSIAWDVAADCGIEVTLSSYETTQPLAIGTHTLQVRAIDTAGNCGPASSFELRVASDLDVDGMPDADPDAGVAIPPRGGGCCQSGSGQTAPIGIAVLLLLLVRRRRSAPALSL